MADHTLYCFAQSGNAYKAALMLNLCGADWAPRFVDFLNGEARTPEYRAINEMGEVPVLEIGGERYTQSGAILHLLVGRFGRFGGADERERLEILRWILWDNHKLTSYIGTLRFLTFVTQGGETEVTGFLRGRATAALGILEGHLKERSWIVAEKPTIADISVCGYLYWPDEFGVSWADHPAIGAWLDRIKGLDGWVHPYELMPGHPMPGREA
jgi:glutathione S-transferase